MRRPRVLFQGSYSGRNRVDGRGRRDRPEDVLTAEPIAGFLGRKLIESDLDLILAGDSALDVFVGAAAEEACIAAGLDPKDRIRTYLYGPAAADVRGFGMVLEPIDKRWQEVRTFLVRESDAVVALIGGKGTSDCLQKAVLAGKPVFPIAVAGGAAQAEWEHLRESGYCNREPGDMDFLADKTAPPDSIAAFIAGQCRRLLPPGERAFSRRVFIVHGRDIGLMNEVARFLDRLAFTPVILHEQTDRGKAIISKLQAELADVGFAFVLLTPDDLGYLASSLKTKASRARQNVIFEHGLLIGLLGPDRVCAIIKGDVEVPSDLSGVLYKHLDDGHLLDAIAVDLAKELSAAGYDIDVNRLVQTRA